MISTYLLLFGDNVFVYLANHSINRETVRTKIWLDGKLVKDDLMQVDPTSKRWERYNCRISGAKSYLITVQVNDGPKIDKPIRLDWFSFIYITIDENVESGLDLVTINNYTLKEAWNMNLIFGVRE